MTVVFTVKDGATGSAEFTLTDFDLNNVDDVETDTTTGIHTATVTIGSGAPAATPVTAANFTMTGYELGKKITDIAVSTSTTGIAALGGYGDSYTIYKDASRTMPVAVGSTEIFAAGTDYWLVLKLSAADGYVINSLRTGGAKLNGKAAIDRGSDFFIFKLDPLTAPALTPVTAANFTMTGYTVGSSVTSSMLAMTTTPANALIPVGAYGSSDTTQTAYMIGTRYDAATHGLYDEITDASVKFAAGTDYYLAVVMFAQSGYSFAGLTKEDVKLDGKTAIDLVLVNDTTAGVIFKLDPLTAPTHTHTKGTWVNEVPATCVATGTKGYFPCTGCDAKLDASGNEITDLTLEKNPANHASGCVAGTAWQKDGTHHWHVYTKCGAVVAASKVAHSYTAGVCACGATHKDTQTITASNVNATYGDTDAKIVATAQTALSYTVKSGDDVVTVGSDGKLTFKKAGEAVVTVTAAETTAYHPATKDVTVTVAKKEIEIEGASAMNRDYIAGNKTVTIAEVGFSRVGLALNTDYTATGEMNDDKAGNSKPVTVTVTLSASNAECYELKNNPYTGTTVTINKIDPTAPTDLTGKTGDKLSSVTLPDGWSWLAPDTTMSEAGEKQFAAKYVDTTGNYNDVASKDLTVTVSDKDAQTITAADVTFTYGETKSIVASTSGNGALSYAVKSGDAVTVDATTGALTFQKAGTATVTVTAAETADYAAATKDVTVTVNKAALTVKAKNQSIYVNGTAPDLTAADAYTVDGLVGTDTVSVSLVYSDTPDVTKTGSYDIIVTATADTDKYELTAVNGTLTISERPSTGGGSHTPTYTITVEDAKNGDVKADRKSASSGTTVTITVDPDKGYTLETLTVLDKNGKEVKLTNKGSGKYTFKMPASKVTVKAVFTEDNSMLNFFVDVPADAYYADAVLWAAENGITGGVDAVHFAPNATCTRAQAVTFLWRAAGSPAPKSTEMPFADVKADSYYYNAVLWAVENGITKGTSETTFSPDVECSRAQIVTFLWRSQKSPAVDAANPFVDVIADAYYADAVLWAAANGITGGTTATTFSPDADCTRAQIVTFIYRCMK